MLLGVPLGFIVVKVIEVNETTIVLITLLSSETILEYLHLKKRKFF